MRVILVVCVLATRVVAQPVPSDSSTADARAASTNPTPGAPVDEAWAAYDAAFAQAAAGDATGANARLSTLAQRWPRHPAALRASAFLRAERPEDDPRGPSKVARGELVFWSTVGGVALAANTCLLVDCQSSREYALVYMGVVGGSLAASILASRHGIHQGEAQLYNSAQTWGAWNGFGILDDAPDTRTDAAIAIGAQAGGLGLGLALWQTWRPTQGDVALTNSFFLWGTVLTLWGHLAADEEPALRTVVIAGDVAIVAGALVSRQVKMSRGRTLLIDIGGILGTLGGGLVAVGLDSEAGAGVSLMLGTGAGLAVAAFATDGWDAPPLKVAPAVVTGPGRSTGFGLGTSFTF